MQFFLKVLICTSFYFMMNFHSKAQEIIDSNSTHKATEHNSKQPLGTCPAIINSFSPASATTGDTVIIQLFIPCSVDSVKFGGVPALSISGTPAITALVKAVVAKGSNGSVTIQNQWGSDSKP